MSELEIELMVANETIREAEESFDRLRKDYHALRERTDKLESYSSGTQYPISCFLGLVLEIIFTIFRFIYSISIGWC